MIETYAANGEFFHRLNDADWCLAQLSRIGAHVELVRIRRSAVVIELSTPLPIAAPIEIKAGYSTAQFCGCTVAWKTLETDHAE